MTSQQNIARICGTRYQRQQRILGYLPDADFDAFSAIHLHPQLTSDSNSLPTEEHRIAVARFSRMIQSSYMQPKNEALSNPSSQNCAICGGTGLRLIRVQDERGRNVEKATACDCQLRSRGQRLLEQARIPQRYKHCELSNFDHEGPFESLASAHRSACRFVAEYPLDNKGLLLIGPIGVGKTHLAVGIIRELILEKGIACLFYDYRELLKEIQNSYNASVQTTEFEVLRPVLQSEVLVLDELAAARSTEWVEDMVSHILNTRYNERRTTIITTNYRNLPPGGSVEAEQSGGYRAAARASREETLGDRIGERMRSRLHEMCRIVKLQGVDYRQYRGACCD
jgi:DNA replication protein DnaC